MKHPESQRIKILRGTETLREFAEKFDVSGSNIQVIEADKQGLAISLAKKIASYYNVTLDWLYGTTEDGGPDLSVHSQIRKSVEKAMSPLSIQKPFENNINDQKSLNEFYDKLLTEKDKQIEFLEKALQDSRNHNEHIKVLYNQLNVMYEYFKKMAEKD